MKKQVMLIKFNPSVAASKQQRCGINNHSFTPEVLYGQSSWH